MNKLKIVQDIAVYGKIDKKPEMLPPKKWLKFYYEFHANNKYHPDQSAKMLNSSEKIRGIPEI